MFANFFGIPFVAGMEDGINPCFLISFSVILLGMLWFKRAGISRLWVLFFLVVMMVSTFAFNCGFWDKVVLNNYFQIAARAIYLLLAVTIGLKGFQFLRQWISMLKGNEIKPEAPVKVKLEPFVITVILLVVGFVLSMLSTLWPINSYIMTFSIYMMLPGKLIVLGPLVFIYTIVSFWFVCIAIPVFALESRNQRLFKMIAAVSLLSASIGVIDIIFMKG